jgi:hypothetical protein
VNAAVAIPNANTQAIAECLSKFKRMLPPLAAVTTFVPLIFHNRNQAWTDEASAGQGRLDRG